MCVCCVCVCVGGEGGEEEPGSMMQAHKKSVLITYSYSE